MSIAVAECRSCYWFAHITQTLLDEVEKVVVVRSREYAGRPSSSISLDLMNSLVAEATCGRALSYKSLVPRVPDFGLSCFSQATIGLKHLLM